VDCLDTKRTRQTGPSKHWPVDDALNKTEQMDRSVRSTVLR